MNTTQVNSALSTSGVAKLRTSFGWGKGGNVTANGCDPTLYLLTYLLTVCQVTSTDHPRVDYDSADSISSQDEDDEDDDDLPSTTRR